MRHNPFAGPGGSPREAKWSPVKRAKHADPKLEGLSDEAIQGPLQGYVGYMLRRAQLAVFADVIATLAEIDLRPAQFSVLIVAETTPGIVQSRASAALGIQKANFVPLLSGLERRGLIERVAVDGRTNGLFLTRKGKATVKRAHALHARHHARVDALIGTKNRALLNELCGRLATLGKAEDDG